MSNAAASKKSLSAFFAKSRAPKPPKKEVKTEEPSGWSEEPLEPGVPVNPTLKNPSKKYLLAVWRNILKQARNSRSAAVGILNDKIAGRRATALTSEWDDPRFPLPEGYVATIEYTDTFRILKVSDELGVEVVHLTIPEDPKQTRIHFTDRTQSRDYFEYDDFRILNSGGRRKTQRRLSKKKRTRRVVRRLVGL